MDIHEWLKSKRRFRAVHLDDAPELYVRALSAGAAIKVMQAARDKLPDIEQAAVIVAAGLCDSEGRHLEVSKQDLLADMETGDLMKLAQAVMDLSGMTQEAAETTGKPLLSLQD